jgi:hypothetical protein
LQGQGRLADARFSAKKHQGAFYKAAAKKTVNLWAAKGDAPLLGGRDF